MGRRQELQAVLESLYISGTPHVYYQPPKDARMVYPCIVYKLYDIPSIHANNRPYGIGHKYQVTVIDSNPESPLVERVAALPTCSMDVPPYVVDNLYHFVFSLYY